MEEYARDEGRQEGLQEGERKGELIGRITILLEILSFTHPSLEEFSAGDLSQLPALAIQLTQQLHHRGH